MPGVVKLTYTGDGSKAREWIEEQVLMRINADCANKFRNLPSGHRLRLIGELYRRLNDGQRLLVVLEVREQTTVSALTKLVLAVKKLGSDQRAATFVLVLSESCIAMASLIDLSELRVARFKAPEFSEDEARDLISRRHCKFSHLANEIMANVGTRPLHIMQVVTGCKFARAETDKECLAQVEAVAKLHAGNASAWVRDFVDSVAEGNGVGCKLVMEFLRQFSTGESVLTNDDAVEVLGFTDDWGLLAALAENKAFTVDLSTKKVQHHSHFTKTAVKQYVDANGTFSSSRTEVSDSKAMTDSKAG
ncbi:hypothetical protein JKP88DRAFT_333507 [Tribonema minus]|uniref:Uncharacterized protein n=1 Tax=Tribonema minus TaxID=303371 RepID=A0A835YKE2_9STRA|nr:hypothetical protein JKP88DRAFT_333507 [Tribonema minus]